MSYRKLLEQLGWTENLIQEVERSAENIRKYAPLAEEAEIEEAMKQDTLAGTEFVITPELIASQTLFFTQSVKTK